MTVLDRRAAAVDGFPARHNGSGGFVVPSVTPAPAGRPPLPLRRYVASMALFVFAAFVLGIAVELLLLGGLAHRAHQQAGFDALRRELALGTAPVSQTAPDGALWPTGTPVAVLDIPAIDLRHEVIVEGTTGGALTNGPGHRRDTVLPGQNGVSVVMGRAAAYGGPFGRLAELEPGTTFTVTTGQGVAKYKVLGSRTAGDPLPSVPAGRGRMTLVTAQGSAFVPTSGVLRVDALLMSPPAPTPSLVAVGPLPAAEREMGTEPATLPVLVLWLQALLVVAVVAVIAWARWGRWQSWLVFVPLAVLVSLFVADQLALLLPNLT